MNIAIITFALMCALYYLVVSVRFQLQMFQQNSYMADRYFRYLKGQFSPLEYIILLILLGNILYFKQAIIAIVFAGIATRIARKKSKKSLVFTPRVVRLAVVAVVISIIAPACAIVAGEWLAAVGMIILAGIISPVVIMLSNAVLTPVQKYINNKYINDAKRILESMPNLKIIGITGSYGKTSTKHFLHKILSQKYNTLMTPGSYNTTLGVVRTIREQLKPYHEVFIVEMGAKEVGDIAQICELVNPQMAILTSIGEQHLESFKSIDNIRKTKFELIDSLPSGGFCAINADFMQVAKGSEGISDKIKCCRYGMSKGVDLHLREINYSSEGSSFSIKDMKSGEVVSFITPIMGRYNISNIVSAYAIARELGVDHNKIDAAIQRLEQVEHRLQVRYGAMGVVIIDDAFNSNPHGADMALEVLEGFAPMQRVVITPGMIELGEKQAQLNKAFGKRMATAADYSIVVGKYNRQAICEGLKEGGASDDSIFTAQSLQEAVAHLGQKFPTGGYVVLYENDLPDTFK